MARSGGLERKVDYGILSAFYGPLLTQRQQTLVRLYCDEDYSLGEVARQLGVTRQGVSDGLKRAFERLDELESALGLHQRLESTRAVMTTSLQAIDMALVQHPELDMLRDAGKALEEHLRMEEA